MPLIGPGRRMRRRAVVGAAAVGGAAYYAGKKGAQAGQERTRTRCPRIGGAGAPAPAEDYIEELEQLAKLHEQGVIDDQEFEAKKEQILGI